MADANGVSEEIPPVPPLHTKLPGMRRLASIGFLILHVTGGAYALVTLPRAWFALDIVQLLVNQHVLFSLFGPVWFLIPVGIALVAPLAVVEVRRTLRRWRRGQPEPDVGLRLRVLVYVALACVFVNAFFLSTAETFSGPFRLRFAIMGEISGAFAYGAYALWSLLLPRLRRVFPGRLRRGLDVLGMNVALLLVFAEISLRVAAVFLPSPLLVTESTTSQLRRGANRERPGTLHFGFPMNQGGHYDTEFVPRSASPNRIVVSIGDSFSYGAVPYPFHFTTVAEGELPGVEIYNMGYSGIGPEDYLYLLEHEAVPLEPDLLVIQLFVGNDVTEGSPPGGPARWYDADSYLVAIVWYRLQIMRRAKLVDAAEATQSSNLTRDELAVLYPQLADPLLEHPSVGDELFFEIETRNALGIGLPRPELYERFFEALTGMERAAGDVPLAFVLIPEEFQVEDDVWEEVARRSGQPLDRDLAQRTIIEWLKARGRAVLDLLPLLRAVEPLDDGCRHLYHLRNLHFNSRGNEVAGRALARFADSLLSTTSAPVSLPLHLAFGSSPTRRWMQSGWQDAGARSHVWSDSLRSVLTVPLPKRGDIQMGFEASPFVFPNSPQQRVSIVLNGTVIEEVPLRPGVHRYSVILPDEALLDSQDTLEFRYAYARAPWDVLPNSPDVRVLAVAWSSIDFEELDP
jgi:hypothetical protein